MLKGQLISTKDNEEGNVDVMYIKNQENQDTAIKGRIKELNDIHMCN